jgi:hypothetical protein
MADRLYKSRYRRYNLALVMTRAFDKFPCSTLRATVGFHIQFESAHVHTDVRQYGLQCTYFQSLDSSGGSCSDFYTTELRAGVLNVL